MGEIDPNTNEDQIKAIWETLGYEVNVKMIRDKFTGYVSHNSIVSLVSAPVLTDPRNHSGYCFLELANPDIAAAALALNGTNIPNTNRQFKLNWASGGGASDKKWVFPVTSPPPSGLDYTANRLLGPSIPSSSAISALMSPTPSFCPSSRNVTPHAPRPRS